MEWSDLKDPMFLMIIAFGLFMFFGLHGAACNLHVAAVDMVRVHRPDAYRLSYAYCRMVGAPLRWLTERR